MRLLTLPWALALLCVALHADPLDSLITAGDLLKISHPVSPALSPDGKKIAYTVRSLETQPSGDIVYRNRLWLATSRDHGVRVCCVHPGATWAPSCVTSAVRP